MKTVSKTHEGYPPPRLAHQKWKSQHQKTKPCTRHKSIMNMISPTAVMDILKMYISDLGQNDKRQLKS